MRDYNKANNLPAARARRRTAPHRPKLAERANIVLTAYVRQVRPRPSVRPSVRLVCAAVKCSTLK